MFSLLYIHSKQGHRDRSEQMEMTWAARKPLPHPTTKSLLSSICWLGDNCWAWKMDAVSSGHADTSIYVREEKKHILDNDPPQLNNEKRGKNHFLRGGNGTERSEEWEAREAICRAVALASDASNSGSASSPLSSFLFLVLSTSVHDLAGCSRGSAGLCNFIRVYFAGIFLSIFSLLQHFPWHYSAFPPLRYAASHLPFCEGGTWGDAVGLRRPCFKACHWVQFGNWSELEEKESSPPRKHLDNCLLQHEKQLEVSGSWEQDGVREGGGRGGGGSAVCFKCEKGQRERERERWGGKQRRSEEEGSFHFWRIINVIKTQYNDYSRKVQFRGKKKAEAAVVKTLKL